MGRVGRMIVRRPCRMGRAGADAAGREDEADLAAAAQVSLVLWGWALVQYPFIVPPLVTIRDAAAPRITLELLLTALAIGAIVLVPSLVYLFRTFSRGRSEAA